MGVRGGAVFATWLLGLTSFNDPAVTKLAIIDVNSIVSGWNYDI